VSSSQNEAHTIYQMTETAPVASAMLKLSRASAWELCFSLSPVETPVTALSEIAAFLVRPTYFLRVMENHLSPLSGTAARGARGTTL
jgi:hypothetical protein